MITTGTILRKNLFGVAESTPAVEAGGTGSNPVIRANKKGIMERKRTENEIRRDLITFFNTMYENGLLNLYYVSLISADNLVDHESCDFVEKRLNEFKDALPETEITEQEAWVRQIEAGLDIIKKERERLG